MLIYLLAITICFFASLQKNKLVEYYFLLLLLLFLCGGYMTGTDWRVYELAYNDADIKKIFDERFEIGYGILQSICNKFCIDFWTFHIVIKIIIFLCTCRFIDYFKANLLLFWALFLPEMGFFLFIDCPFRNLIAFGIWGIAVPSLLERRAIAYFLLITLAFCFHSSALILYFLYFLWGLHLKNKYWLILFVLMNIMAYKLDYILDNFFVSIFDLAPLLKDKLLAYILDEKYLSSKINIGTIYRAFFFLFLLYYRTRIEEKHQYGKILFYLSMVFFIIYPFTISLKIFSRFSIYLLPFYILNIILLLSVINKSVIRYFVLSILLGWTFIKSYVVLTEDYRYIPYSNYFLYLMEERPSYRYRSNYNINESPYGKN